MGYFFSIGSKLDEKKATFAFVAKKYCPLIRASAN